ncbi:MAG: biopolymer transporter ExbD [Chitinophagaceae bacterium]|nr:biopolymer transporter ExbD [Chitinophagaceae bacterium]
MGEITISSKSKGTKPERKKLSTRVDLTPMVDLGFLLITFFIFTTTMDSPKAMALKLPVNSPDPSKAEADKTVNLLLGKDDKIWYYHGVDIDKINSTDFSKGIRKIIIDKINLVGEKYRKPNETIVLIKPTQFSSYKNIVDILDEMTINGVTRRVLMEPTEQEIERIPR